MSTESLSVSESSPFDFSSSAPFTAAEQCRVAQARRFAAYNGCVNTVPGSLIPPGLPGGLGEAMGSSICHISSAAFSGHRTHGQWESDMQYEAEGLRRREIYRRT